MVYSILDVALAVLLGAPLIIFALRLREVRREKQKLASFALLIALFNVSTMATFFPLGELTYTIIMWQLLFVWPLSIGFYITVFKNDWKAKRKGFQIGTIITLSLLFISAIVAYFVCINRVEDDVKNSHEVFIKELHAAEDRNLYLLEKTNATNILENEEIEKIKNGEFEIRDVKPWQSVVKVTGTSGGHYWTRELTYSRVYDTWTFEGIYFESEFY